MLSLKLFAFAIFCVRAILCLQKVYCEADDGDCITNSVKERIIPKLLSGTSGIETVDPVYLDTIQVDLPTLNYTLYDATLTGLKDCDIYVKRNAEDTLFQYKPCCRKLTVEARYVAEGKLDAVSVRGKGTVKLTYGNFNLTIIGNQEKVQLGDCRQHFRILNYTVHSNQPGKTAYDYKNLIFGAAGRCKCNPALRTTYFDKFEEVTRTPIMEAFVSKIMDSIKKFHIAVPVEELYYKYV